MNSRSFRQVLSLSAITALMLGFQNCGKAPGALSDQSTAVVSGVTSSYSKVSYNPSLEIGGTAAQSSEDVQLDLNTGNLKIRQKGSTEKNCQVDVTRSQQLAGILSTARVCHPEPVASGAVSCLAVSTADIQLSSADDSDQLLLAKALCHTGTFLCDGDDDKLRSLIKDLLDHPPANCQ